MGNRIIFEASIDTGPFRRAINEMTEITNAFFDTADSRANIFSENLGNVGSNFNISEQFDAANRSISEGASAVGIYNGNLQGIIDSIFNITIALATVLGPKGVIVAATGLLAREFVDIAPRLFMVSNEAIREMTSNWYQLDRFTKSSMDNLNTLNRDVENSNRSMVDGVSGAIQSKNYFWNNADDSRQSSTEEANEAITNSFKNVSEIVTKDIVPAMKGEWGTFCDEFKTGTEDAVKSATKSFEAMSLDVREGAITKMRQDYDGLWEEVKEGAGETSSVIKGFFKRLPDGIKSPINGIISFINGMVQRAVSGFNSLISGINSMGFDLPSWLGGGSFRINIPKINAPQIPMLARGGIVDRPTLALIGERGKEAVMPLENNTGWISDLANSIGAVVGAQLAFNQGAAGNVNYGLDSYNIRLYLDGRKVAEGIMDDFVEVARQRDIKFSPVFA
jgi:hypothetical protein